MVVARTKAVQLKTGDDLLILDKDALITSATIQSLQVNNVDYGQLDAADGQEVGIRLSARCIPGNALARLAIPPVPVQQLPLLAPDEYPEVVTAEDIEENVEINGSETSQQFDENG